MGKLCKSCVRGYTTVKEIGGGMMDGGYYLVMNLGNILRADALVSIRSFAVRLKWDLSLPYPYYSQPILRSFWVRYKEGRLARR